MIIHFFLAERCYLNECSFILSPCTLLENKARALPSSIREKESPVLGPGQPIRFIYSGTIAESYGIFDCIHLIHRWRLAGHACSLHIIGYCPREDTLQQLKALIADKPYITLTGGDSFVPHQLIVEALLSADMALIGYQLNPSNQHCFPTRLWECLAYQVPMLMREEHPWKEVLRRYQAGYTLDFTSENPTWPFVNTLSFYDKTPVPPDIFWGTEEIKLLQVIDSLF